MGRSIKSREGGMARDGVVEWGDSDLSGQGTGERGNRVE